MSFSKPFSSERKSQKRPVLVGAENTLIRVETNFSYSPVEQEEEEKRRFKTLVISKPKLKIVFFAPLLNQTSI